MQQVANMVLLRALCRIGWVTLLLILASAYHVTRTIRANDILNYSLMPAVVLYYAVILRLTNARKKVYLGHEN